MKKRSYPTVTGAHLPPCLQEIPDAPTCLFAQGKTDLLFREPKIAVIGAREASPYGAGLAAAIGRDLAAAGVCVVSGLARGIDGLVQEAVVEAGGDTIAVLGTAIDDIRPQSNRELAGQILRKGLIVSEYGPGVAPRNWFFPARNRIISGLSRAVVIIEAGSKSGTMITANHALDQGREVLAFPGPVDAAMSAGTHELIRQGARLVRNAHDILEDLNMKGALELPFENGAVTTYNNVEIDDPLVHCLGKNPVSLEELMEKSGLEHAELNRLLLQQELEGRIRQLPGPRYVRCL